MLIRLETSDGVRRVREVLQYEVKGGSLYLYTDAGREVYSPTWWRKVETTSEAK